MGMNVRSDSDDWQLYWGRHRRKPAQARSVRWLALSGSVLLAARAVTSGASLTAIRRLYRRDRQ
jgi:hypothetical protein